MKLILPFPPSVNTYWRHPNKGAFAGKSLISAAGRKFQSAACAAIVEQLRRLPKPTSAPASVEIVLFPPDNGNFVGDGIRQALMARAGFEKTERDNVYNGMTLREYARMSLTERGIGVSSYNPMQMVGAAFTHSTSDFGNILLDVANKAILQGWEDAPETYEQWTRKGQLSDFKIAHRVGMGGFSALRQVREGAEYKYVTTGDKQATIALATYGELFSITRQAIINDDLNMLTDVPMKLGRAAKSTIADLVYAILTSNPKISTDNVSLFDKAKHANVLESAAMDVASLDKARQLMRVQKEGERDPPETGTSACPGV